MCHLYLGENVKLLWKFFYINLGLALFKVTGNGIIPISVPWRYIVLIV